MNCEIIRFSPTAWAKIIYMRDKGDTEIGGFGITPIEDPLFVEDFRLIKQKSSSVTCYFDDLGVADHFDKCDDEGLEPCQYGRIWIHTHPGNSPHPSPKDEQTFKEKFSGCDFKVMFILAKGGDTYCRLKLELKNGLFSQVELNMGIDCSGDFDKPERDKWSEEYRKNVTIDDAWQQRNTKYTPHVFADDYKYDFETYYNQDESFEENHFWEDEGICFYYDEDSDSVFEYDEDQDIFYITGENEDDIKSVYEHEGSPLDWMEDFKKMVEQRKNNFQNTEDDKDIEIFTF